MVEISFSFNQIFYAKFFMRFYFCINISQSITPILNISIEKAVDLQRSNRFVWDMKLFIALYGRLTVLQCCVRCT